LACPSRDHDAVSDGAPNDCVKCSTCAVGRAPGSATHRDVALSNTKPKGDVTATPDIFVVVCDEAVGKPLPTVYKPAAAESWNVAYT